MCIQSEVAKLFGELADAVVKEVCAYVSLMLCVYVCMYACMYVFMYVCMFIFVCAYGPRWRSFLGGFAVAVVRVQYIRMYACNMYVCLKQVCMQVQPLKEGASTVPKIVCVNA